MRPEPLKGISLSDSWVLSLEATEGAVIFVLDAVLEQDHPWFSWPPKQGEQQAYARRWRAMLATVPAIAVPTGPGR